jgi:TRAP-type C4-dicarboxylate transport system substrate-binding protein
MEAGIFPMTMALALPGYVTNATVGSMVFQKLLEEGYTAPEWADVHPLFGCVTTPNDLGSRRPVHTMADWKGLKVAVMGEPTNSTVAALGATPVGLSVPEWYISLERGTVDACWLEFHAQVSYKFYEVAPYMTACRGNATSNMFCMSKETYNSLPPDIREIVDRNSGMAWAIMFGKRFDSNFARAVYYLQNALEEADNPPVYFPTDDEMAKWQQAWEPVINTTLNDLEAQGLPAQAMWDRANELAERYSAYQLGGISYPYWEWWE